MRKIILMAAAAVCLSGQLFAQNFKTSGRKAVQLAPKDWTVEESHGDLNKDGISDLVILATPHDETKAFFNDDGLWEDHNMPVVAVYLGSDSGVFRLLKTYSNCYPEIPEGCSRSCSAGITSRHTIRLSYIDKSPDGSVTSIYIFRWQNGDFYNIGKSKEVYDQKTGFTVFDSYNYSIKKHQHQEYVGSPDSQGATEEWSDITTGPIPMGSHSL